MHQAASTPRYSIHWDISEQHIVISVWEEALEVSLDLWRRWPFGRGCCYSGSHPDPEHRHHNHNHNHVIIIVTPVDRILQFCNNIPGCLLLSCNTWVTKGAILRSTWTNIKPGVIRRLPSPVKSYSATKAGAKVSAFAKNQDNIYSPMTLPLGFPPWKWK